MNKEGIHIKSTNSIFTRKKECTININIYIYIPRL